jgi:glutamine amidotransferase
MGNLGSIANMIKKIGTNAIISSKIADIESASKLILPGVGAFDSGMKRLKESGLLPALDKKVHKLKTPILGICLGMQLFTLESEEGEMPGLGWIEAKTVRFKFNSENKNLKIPHIGWNTVTPKAGHKLFENFYQEPRFYFVHSYHVVCSTKENNAATTFYGYEFISSFQKDNVYGVQFHPEKSHRFGMQLLKNFTEVL